MLNLLTELGEACAEYHDRNVGNLRVRRLQCDEIWSFVGTLGCSHIRLSIEGDLVRVHPC